MIKNKYILLTIDVEDWFQVENFKPWIPFDTWDQRELRVQRNVHRLLDLFDSVESAGKREGGKAGRLEGEEAGGQEVEISPRTHQTSKLPGFQTSRPPSRAASQPQASGSKLPSLPASQLQALSSEPPNLPTSQHPTEPCPKATFFVLAWIAEKLPQLIREIHARGHEVASHGCNHQLSNQLSHQALTTELDDSRKILEDIIGAPINGFRSPSFAINNYVIRQIAESGYLYDSSLNSFKMHNRYGQIDLSANDKKGIALKISDTFFELPLSNLKLMDKVIPWGGGAYFRLFPYRLFKRGVQSILKKDGAYVFYIHPWEIDPFQPKVNQAPFSFKFRHYTNLNKTKTRLKNLMTSFDHCQFITCIQYLSKFA